MDILSVDNERNEIDDRLVSNDSPIRFPPFQFSCRSLSICMSRVELGYYCSFGIISSIPCLNLLSQTPVVFEISNNIHYEFFS